METPDKKNTPAKLLAPYNPTETETRIYSMWEESGFFNPDVCVEKGVTDSNAKHFSIVLPPPNVTGTLHLGHAYEDSLQDTAVRFHRMRGEKTVWIPGTDSAAIATQSRVEKNIQKDEGKTRHDLGREELVKRVSAFAKQSENTILNQVRKMGASLDWSRYAYTLDDTRNTAVFTAFKNMYDAGLIYRGNRIVNWDPKGQTTVSDDEIVYEERKSILYTFKYSKDFPVSISTTRLETKIGDTAVAVHPDDPRYKNFIGKTFEIPNFCGIALSIKIIADKEVDPEFGTGALGVTPAHSMIDWEIAERHDLPKIQVIDEYTKIKIGDEKLKGKKVLEAREIIATWLRTEGLLEKEEEIPQNVATAERTGGIIEPLPKLQWFVGVNKPFVIKHSEIPGIESGSTITLKELMRISVEKGGVSMPQENFQKVYFNWINNLHDWCISRQIWFGHQIPVWYKGDEMYVGATAPTGSDWTQDPDVLDTWFSSALWTFSTLGWPEKTNDLSKFHPTSFMSPAYEILPLWVSRMILMSGFHLGQIPFEKVMLHGIVRDSQGRKFSKSLGNGIDPLDVINKFGTDALRMGLLSGTAIGNDITFDENKIRGFSKFSNKLWNIQRFVLENTQDVDMNAEFSKEDQKSFDDLNALIAEITKEMEEYKFYLVAEKLYHYSWHEFADIIIERCKKNILENNNPESAKKLLMTILPIVLKTLHPFMPYVTEELWSLLPDTKGRMLMVEKWPC